MRAVRVQHHRRNRGKSRGFTLVELLTVVAITGVLATIGTMLVRKHFVHAKSNEATAIMQAIRVAEEARRAETGSYQSCSGSTGTPWYPATPDGKVRAWSSPSHPDIASWQTLDIKRAEGTQFGFLAFAGGPGATIPAPVTVSKPVWSAQTDPWYLIEAAGDRDNDTKLSLFVTTSFNGEIYVENDDE